ncbi:hypothetical protein [Falsiruegeria mediterranea]|uniref:Uncharacterized protein n=1 Tax=Falsiruegeria mediterranea M17 TaxID=1200281 RepID=A0A2R8CBF3_9RHOB|nr:hypothetical protein [Falsiruegeria mediterranea]SPJ29790.1 hypothetical protein TRM7615_03312 [Falsiruegeria mediterranea M17]
MRSIEQRWKQVVFPAQGMALSLLIASGSGVVAQDVSNRDLADITPNIGLPRSSDGVTAELLSAFHGLDSLPLIANVICRGGWGKGGMPVIFATEVDLDTLQAGDFQVTRQSGETRPLHCVSVLPAVDPGELRTVLLIGDLGPSDSDPPVTVEVIGHLHSIDGTLDYQGAQVAVTPLADGPSLVLAQSVKDWTLVGELGPRRVRGSLCPKDTVLAVRVTWAGGVTLANGDEPGEAERQLYRVTVEDDAGAQRDITPAALADLGDGDNNHMLCLDTTNRVLSVSFPAGILVDPNKDLNPATTVEVDAPN